MKQVLIIGPMVFEQVGHKTKSYWSSFTNITDKITPDKTCANG